MAMVYVRAYMLKVIVQTCAAISLQMLSARALVISGVKLSGERAVST